MIGLIDYDFLTSKKSSILIPNIEIMKLATYYKNEENHFCRMLTLDETELENYDKIYFFSEINKEPKVPQSFLKCNNIIYGGCGFTKKYLPFTNELIDYTIPKTFIYADFLKQKYNDGIKTKVISQFLDGTYYRMYAGDKKLPLPSIIPNKKVFLYDKDFFYKDWEKTLDKIIERKPSSIIRIHPTICTNLTNYFKIRSYNKFARTNEIILDIDIPLDKVNYMFNKYKNLFLADITINSKVFLPLGGNLSTNILYFKDFIYKINLLFSFWSKGIPIKIKYITPDLGFNNPLNKISIITEHIAELDNLKKMNSTLNDKIEKKRKINILKEEKDLLLKFHPTAINLFNQSFLKLKERGFWRI